MQQRMGQAQAQQRGAGGRSGRQPGQQGQAQGQGQNREGQPQSTEGQGLAPVPVGPAAGPNGLRLRAAAPELAPCAVALIGGGGAALLAGLVAYRFFLPWSARWCSRGELPLQHFQAISDVVAARLQADSTRSESRRFRS